ncbi:hypothetical protein HK100_002863 [Physocladia obscura]|uniref:Arrestin C-terminal-like domain-containing protein n=1 Tax=Physocladia obscura TaxID=109957 RepID=A0AAD5XAS5_9FUNG|nr:hypothetical protein HK100_002863 [Physocladia obscura]
MSVELQLQPLADADEDTQIGNSAFVYGYCGLETSYLRGIVRVKVNSRTPLAVVRLTIGFRGVQRLIFTRESGEKVDVEKVLVFLSETLLANETLAPESEIQIPFQLQLPDPDPKHANLVRQTVRLSNLPIPAGRIKGFTSYGAPFETFTKYSLYAEIEGEKHIPSLSQSLASFLTTATAPATTATKFTAKETVDVAPFVVHDPRQLPLVMLPDGKRWRSAPGDTPLEYEIELSATTVGPSDSLSLLYRLAVARDAAANGVRVKKVVLVLREHRTLGTTISHLIPPSYKCARSSTEITRWEFYEQRLGNASDDSLNADDFGFEVEGDSPVEFLAPTSVLALGSNDNSSMNDDTNIPSLQSGLQQFVPSQANTASPRLKVSKIVNRRKPPNASASSNANTNTINQQQQQTQIHRAFNAGTVEMNELRPRRKLADGMSSYNPSHFLSTNASSYDHTSGSSALSITSPRFADGWSSGPGGDGLYVENQVQIQFPSNYAVTPDTFKPPPDPSLIYPNPHAHIYASVPFVDVKHTLQVRVEMHGYERAIVHECWCVVASVGRRECVSLLEERADLMPTLDYDKVFGGEMVWVPAYERVDSFLGANSSNNESASNDGSKNNNNSHENHPNSAGATEINENRNEIQEFFGEWAKYVPNGYRPPVSITYTPLTVIPSPSNVPPSNVTQNQVVSMNPTASSSTLQPSFESFVNSANYFQKRPSISSLLSFTAKSNHLGGAISPPNSNNHSLNNSDNESDLEKPLPPSSSSSHHEKAKLSPPLQQLSSSSPPPPSPPLQTLLPNITATTSRRKGKLQLPSIAAINTQSLLSTSEIPPLPSAHTLIATDASGVEVMRSPTNARLMQEIKTAAFSKRTNSNRSLRRSMHYPQTNLQDSNSSSENEDGKYDVDSDDEYGIVDDGGSRFVDFESRANDGAEEAEEEEEEEHLVLRHPLLDDADIEARRRRVVAKRRKLARQKRLQKRFAHSEEGLLGFELAGMPDLSLDESHGDGVENIPPILEGEEPPAYSSRPTSIFE